MNWNKSKSIILSMVFVGLFALILLAADVFSWALCGVAADTFFTLAGDRMKLLVTLWACSLFGWICLYSLLRLLINIWRGDIFSAKNVTYMRLTSWCCFAVAVICLISALIYCLPLLIVAGAAGFMGLIVRIVKNIFQQALDMKNELDYTV